MLVKTNQKNPSFRFYVIKQLHFFCNLLLRERFCFGERREQGKRRKKKRDTDLYSAATS